MNVFDAVFHAIDMWLKDTELTDYQLKLIKKKLRQNILQMKSEGLLSFAEIAELEKLSVLWIELLHSLGGDKNRILKLFYYDKISPKPVNRVVKFC